MSAFKATTVLLKGAKSIKLASTSISPPAVWQRGISNLFESEILPPSLGGNAENLDLAWHGDKILGIHVANSLTDILGHPLHRGVATELYSEAVSNRFMRKHFMYLAPTLAKAQDIESKLTDEDAGTIIEAMVARVSSKSIEKGQKSAPEIIDLSQYLAKGAIVDKIQSGMK